MRPTTLLCAAVNLMLLLTVFPRAAAGQSGLAPAQDQVNIAVYDFSGKNVTAADASIVTDFIRAGFVNNGRYAVVEKGHMDKILAEAAFQRGGGTETERAVEIGRILNVKKMVVGTLSKLEGLYYVTGSVIDVQTARIEGSKTVSCDRASGLLQAANSLVDQLAADRAAPAAGRTSPAANLPPAPKKQGDLRAEMKEIIPGQTTRSAVHARLGSPDRELRSKNAVTWVYHATGKYGRTWFIDFLGEVVTGVAESRDGIQQRAGFVLGIGAGGGAGKGTGDTEYSKGGSGATFEIGYAPTDWLAFLFGRTAISLYEDQDKEDVTAGVTGLSVRVFPFASFYLQATAGSGDAPVKVLGKYYEATGGGVLLHAGYELPISRRWTMSPELFWGRVAADTLSFSDAPSVTVDQKVNMAGFMLRFTWYP